MRRDTVFIMLALVVLFFFIGRFSVDNTPKEPYEKLDNYIKMYQYGDANGMVSKFLNAKNVTELIQLYEVQKPQSQYLANIVIGDLCD